MSVVAVLSVNMVTANMLLSVFFVSGVAGCKIDSALYITAPKKMEALSGSCLQIPCSFTIKSNQMFDSIRKTYGVWIKTYHSFKQNLQNVIFNSSWAVNTYPMDFTGNLGEKNCTTLFSSLISNYTDIYFFRVENRPFLATAVCDSVEITVKDSPPSPRIEIPGEADLKEKESVTITCSALTPCPHSPPKLTWNLQQDSHNKIEENTNGTFTTKIQETITLSDQHDGYNITCSARYPVNGGQDVKTAVGTKTLSVSYAPKDTSVSISPSGLVSAGSWVNLTCSSRAKPPVSSFTWFKDSTDGPMSLAKGQIYSFNVTDGGNYYCVATNDLGNQTSSIVLNIEELPNGSLEWRAILGVTIGMIMLIILVVCIYIFMSWRRLKSTDSTPLRNQNQTGREPTVEETTRKTEEGEENIHYGEIDFSKQRSEPSPKSVRDIGLQQDTLYAHVNVPKPASSITQTADGLDDLYAQVKKK